MTWRTSGPRRPAGTKDGSLALVFGLAVVAAAAIWLLAVSPLPLARAKATPAPATGAAAASRAYAVAVLASHGPARASATTGPATPVPSTPAPRPAATLARTPFAMDIYVPGSFVSQIDTVHCMSAAMQNMLNLLGPRIDRTASTQRRIASIALPLSTDTIDGGEGPAGWAAGLTRLGAGRYDVRVYSTRAAALRDGVLALRRTGRPVGILAWWGAHSWVLTGFKADADPALFGDFTVSGYRIVDPWYPRISTIWGAAKPPDSLRSPADMVHNLPAWTRPEGHYPTRDGKWLMIVPVDLVMARHLAGSRPI